MKELLESQFVEDLKEGKLPEVTVVIPKETLINIGIMAMIVSTAVLLLGAIIKKIGA